jgi:hypothetical protein
MVWCGMMRGLFKRLLLVCAAVLSSGHMVPAAGPVLAEHILICKEGTLFRVPADPIPSVRAHKILTHSRVGGNEADILWKPHMPPLDAWSFEILYRWHRGKPQTPILDAILEEPIRYHIRDLSLYPLR